eukprot:2086613-Ditylum_brightwellii.AAC.1
MSRLKQPPQSLDQGNGAASCTWALLVKSNQDKIDLYIGLVRATRGQVSPEKEKNSWFMMEFKWDKDRK